jgi:NAD(P)-dependent dehydrogenase (short-subunit alcohol dehydrogenase family)
MKTIILTGASSGLGLNTAKYLCAKGYHVIATMRDIVDRNSNVKDELLEYAIAQNGQIDVLELDITCENSITAFMEIVVTKTSNIYCLINNAGLGALGFIESFSLAQAKQVFDVNFFGILNLTNAILPVLRKSNDSLIINISSAGGRLCFPFLGLYNASKYALEGLSESWKMELAHMGIDICLIEPGAYPSELHNNRLIPSKTEIINDYGDLKDAPMEMVNAMVEAFSKMDELPDSDEIAIKIEELIELTFGDRPIRSVVGSIATDGIRELNKETIIRQEQLLNSFNI